jgi:arylsulfatase A-like enzyme
VLACSCGVAGAPPRAADGAPSVLLISIDTLRADHLGFYGYERPTSPELDRLAAGAAVFEAAEASAPWTLPALASLLTSEHGSTHGCWDYGSVLDDSFTTLPELLLAAGYDTACIASHLFVTTRHGLQQGIVHTDDSYAYPEVEPEESITSQAIADRAIRFLGWKAKAPERAPWFLWLHFFDPHAAYMEHPGISEQFVTSGQRSGEQVSRDRYDGEIRYTDQHVGRVLAALEVNGQAARTLVVLVADHGEEFWDHGAHGHGHSLHREVLRVPLVLRAPGLAPRRIPDVVRQIDVLPTVLELCGVPVPSGIAGRSLVPLLRGETLAPASALSELDLNTNTLDGLRRGDLRLIRAPGTGAARLYDLGRDPLEQQELDDPALRDELTAELERLQAAARERARLFGPAGALEFTPGQAEDLSKLGYGGEQR